MQPLWFRDAVIYQVDVAFFRDSDGDGWGDLGGVCERLDHIRGLGANCIWLLPFYRSPYRDGGYDVTDHLSVDPRFGDLADFAMLMDKADDLGVRVILDLVVQHTSVEHRWFEEARRNPDSPYRDYYIWADEPEETDVSPIFPGVEESVWTWDEEAEQYYRHVFYGHEPDLNLANPAVRDEIRRIMSFWLRLGVAGFRVDAVPYMVESAAAADPRDDGLWLLDEMRELASLHRPDAILLGEVDVAIEKYPEYYGNGQRMTMLLNFWLNNNTFLALARREGEPLRKAVDRQPVPPTRGQYANFLRNHDELDLEQLSEEQREEVLAAFAPEDDMRIYGRGIRRRLAPMLDGDERRIALAHALLLSLPGSPVLLYGDEIGMGDDLSREERRAVRTPMQWSDGHNAGFSSAAPEDLPTAVVSGGRFGYERVNVYAQTMGQDSLLAKIGNLVRTRAGSREIGAGTAQLLEVDCPPVLALLHQVDGLELLTLLNLAAEDVRFDLPDRDISGFVDVLADSRYDRPEGRAAEVLLRGYGYRWLRRKDDLFR